MDSLFKVHPWQIEPRINHIFKNINTEEVEVSLVIPFFNQEKTLKKCLECSMNNIISNFELILIDDASEDNSYKIALNTIEEYQSKFNFLSATIISNNYPIFETGCDNQGFKLAKGKYIIEIQSDIYINEHGYDKTMIKIQNFANLSTVSAKSIHSLAMILGKKYFFKNQFQFLNYRLNQQHFDLHYSKNKSCIDKNKLCFITGETCPRGPWLLLKEDLEKYGYLDQKNFFLGNDDHDYNYRIFKITGRICGFVALNCFSEPKEGASRRKKSGINKKIFDYLRSKRLSKTSQLIKHFGTYKPYAKLSFKYPKL